MRAFCFDLHVVSFAEAFYPVSDSEGVFYQSELPLPLPLPVIISPLAY